MKKLIVGVLLVVLPISVALILLFPFSPIIVFVFMLVALVYLMLYLMVWSIGRGIRLLREWKHER